MPQQHLPREAMALPFVPNPSFVHRGQRLRRRMRPRLDLTNPSIGLAQPGALLRPRRPVLNGLPGIGGLAPTRRALFVLPLRRQRSAACERCGPDVLPKPLLGPDGQGGLG
jgi:hypothetical protein